MACHEMPLAFSEVEGKLRIVALLSPIPGLNLFVSGTGEWLGTYVPLLLRTYPFRLTPDPSTKQLVLAVDDGPKEAQAEQNAGQ